MKISPKTIGIAALAVVVATFVGLMAIGLANKSPVTGKSGATRIDKPAADFTMPLFDGSEFALSEYSGQPFIINFWASWCFPCRQEARALERAWRTYRDRGITLIGVDLHDEETDARSYLREFDVTYPNGIDTNGTISVDYGVIGLPVTFFVNKQGIVERRWVGAIPEVQLITWVQELITGEVLSEEIQPEDLENFQSIN